MRAMLAKSHLMESGIGSIDTTFITETRADDCGGFAHLTKSEDGRYFLSITDMEEFDGAYMSVEVAADDPWIAALEAIKDNEAA